MKSVNYKTYLYIIPITMFLITVVAISSLDTYVFGYATAIRCPENILVKQTGERGLILTWKNVDGATGYEVYKAKSNLGGYKKVKTLKKIKYKDKSVKLGKSGTYKVRAYTVQNGEKVYSKFSYSVSARVCGKSDKKRNAVSPEVIFDGETKVLTLGIRESINEDFEEIFATPRGPKKKNGKGRYQPLNKRLRWYSTDSSIVKVKSSKEITAGIKSGKAYIYAVAHNGRKSKMIPVEVKDYAYEQVDIQYAPGEIQVLFNLCEKQIRDIFSYYTKNNNMQFGEYYSISYDGETYKIDNNTSNFDETKIPIIKEILEASPFQATEVRITKGRVEIKIKNHPAGEDHLIFFFNRNKASENNYKEISPYWYCDSFTFE